MFTNKVNCTQLKDMLLLAVDVLIIQLAALSNSLQCTYASVCLIYANLSSKRTPSQMHSLQSGAANNRYQGTSENVRRNRLFHLAASDIWIKMYSKKMYYTLTYIVILRAVVPLYHFRNTSKLTKEYPIQMKITYLAMCPWVCEYLWCVRTQLIIFYLVHLIHC